jgi:peptidoglycan/xylan/chitin deacetylase (PgdA/CDA1 family)
MTKSTDLEVTPIMERNEAKRIRKLKGLNLPEGCRMVINFTTDFDTMVFRKHLNEPFLWAAQGEFGGRLGMWRLLDLFNAHKIKATVFLPGFTGVIYPDVVQHAAETGHELANHMWLHYVPDDKEVERQHIENTDSLIKKISGAYPVGTRSQHDLSLLGNRKYLYYSYLPDGDQPVYVFNKELNEWILNIPINLLYDDAMYFYFGWFGSKNQQQRIESPNVFYDVLIRSFRRLYNTTGYMNICLHPNISGRSLRILMLEKFIKEIKKYDGVICETSTWIAKHVAKHCAIMDNSPKKE